MNGATISGLLVTYTTWHWIFILNIPIGLLGIFYARKYMPDFTMPKRAFDIIGFLLFGSSLVLISVSLEIMGRPDIASYLPVTVLLVVY